MKLEVGKRYINRNGQVTDRLVANLYDNNYFPFYDHKTRFSYSAEGSYLIQTPCLQDLIAEYVEPESNVSNNFTDPRVPLVARIKELEGENARIKARAEQWETANSTHVENRNYWLDKYDETFLKNEELETENARLKAELDALRPEHEYKYDPLTHYRNLLRDNALNLAPTEAKELDELLGELEALRPQPVVTSTWHNVGRKRPYGDVLTSRDDADVWATRDRIAVLRIDTWSCGKVTCAVEEV